MSTSCPHYAVLYHNGGSRQTHDGGGRRIRDSTDWLIHDGDSQITVRVKIKIKVFSPNSMSVRTACGSSIVLHTPPPSLESSATQNKDEEGIKRYPSYWLSVPEIAA